jgi:hypothetical protein
MLLLVQNGTILGISGCRFLNSSSTATAWKRSLGMMSATGSAGCKRVSG